MKKFLFIASTILLLGALVACTANESTPNTTNETNEIETIVANMLTTAPTSTPIPTETLVPTSSDTPEVNAWVWHSIDLYDLELKLPTGWTINETNRRSDPTPIEVNPTPQHDCAEYNIGNPDDTINFLLKPSCGMVDGAPGYCPNDIVMVSRQNDATVHYIEHGDLIGRFYDSNKAAYIYTGIGFPVLSEQIQLACYYPETVSVKKEQGYEFIYVEYQHIENETNLDQTLNIIDEIVLSIKEKNH